jgi:hypothetical protein
VANLGQHLREFKSPCKQSAESAIQLAGGLELLPE